MSEGAHLNDTELAGFVDNRLDGATRRRAIAHLDTCDDCRAELIATRQLASGYRGGAIGRTVSKRWMPVGVAIAAGLAALMLFRGVIRSHQPAETVRAPVIGSADAAPRIIAVSPRDGAAVTTAVLQFTWRAYDADTYRFVLLEEDGTPAWSTDTHDTSLVLPAAIALAPGKTYFWRVDALADGITASTGTLRVQVPR